MGNDYVALGDAVALGFGDERGTRPDAQEPQLVLEVVAHVLAAMIVAQREARRDARLNVE